MTVEKKMDEKTTYEAISKYTTFANMKIELIRVNINKNETTRSKTAMCLGMMLSAAFY